MIGFIFSFFTNKNINVLIYSLLGLSLFFNYKYITYSNKLETKLELTNEELNLVRSELELKTRYIDKLKSDHDRAVNNWNNEKNKIESKYNSDLKTISENWKNKIPKSATCEQSSNYLKSHALELKNKGVW